MKKAIYIFSILAIAACSSVPSTGSFGTKFEKKNTMDFKTAITAFESGKDTVYQIEGSVDQVCQHGQCWLNMKSDSVELRVDTQEKFKLPKDAKGKKAIANGNFVRTKDGEVEFMTTGVVIE